MRLFECGTMMPGCQWHTRADEDAEIVRRAVDHLRTTHGSDRIGESTIEHIKERIHDERDAAAA